MSEFYDSLAAEAHELLAEFGQPAVLIRETDGVYNAGRVTAAQTASDTVVVTSDYNANEIGGSVLATDTKVLMSAKGLAITPVKGDRIRVDDITYSIENVKVTKPGGVPVIIELQARA